MKNFAILLCCCLILVAGCKSGSKSDKSTDTTKKEIKKENTQTAKKPAATEASGKADPRSKIDVAVMKKSIQESKFSKDISAIVKTNKGSISLDLYAVKCPVTVSNFVLLAKSGFYDDLQFHRVIPNFMVQGGCPLGNGTGNPGYKFQDEFVAELKHDTPGVLSMANSGPATNGSQFFITHKATPWLDGKHTVFGKVKSAADQAIVDAIVKGDVIQKIVIVE